jgi:surface antigen
VNPEGPTLREWADLKERLARQEERGIASDKALELASNVVRITWRGAAVIIGLVIAAAGLILHFGR